LRIRAEALDGDLGERVDAGANIVVELMNCGALWKVQWHTFTQWSGWSP
jgi:hypothetical protein